MVRYSEVTVVQAQYNKKRPRTRGTRQTESRAIQTRRTTEVSADSAPRGPEVRYDARQSVRLGDYVCECTVQTRLSHEDNTLELMMEDSAELTSMLLFVQLRASLG